MPALRFHQATCALLGQTPLFSDRAAAALDACERRLGRTLPSSVHEWYTLDRAVALLRTYSNNDDVMDSDRIGEKTPWDHDDAVHRALYGDAYDDPLMVPFLVETAGVFQLAFTLDDSDDPPVFAWWHRNAWELWAESFSRCLYLWVWDHIGHYRYFRQHRKRYIVVAVEPGVRDTDLQLLRAHLEEVPRALRIDRTYRFQRGDQQLTIRPYGIGRPREMTWVLEADSAAGVEELIRTVWPCGNLATTLWSTANYDLRDEGQRILVTMRGRRE
jgi:hypothetical protein